MFVDTVIEYLKNKIQTENKFEKVFGLVDAFVDSSGNKFPTEYIGNGKFKPINISAYNGVVYFKKNGDVTNLNVTSQYNHRGNCDDIHSISIPLKIIAFKKKSELPTDCLYSDDYVAEQLLASLMSSNPNLKSTLNAMSVSVSWNAYSTNSILIWQSETSAENVDVNTNMACVSVDAVINIVIEKNCIQFDCQN